MLERIAADALTVVTGMGADIAGPVLTRILLPPEVLM